MTPSIISLLLVLTLALAVTTTAVLQDNHRYRQEMLSAADKDAVLRKFSFERYDRALRKTGWGERFRSEEHTSELQSRGHLVCRLLLEKKKSNYLKDNDTI